MFVPGCSAAPSRALPDSARWQAAARGRAGRGAVALPPPGNKPGGIVSAPALLLLPLLEAGRGKERVSGCLGQAECVRLRASS